ncbi:MAG: ABC transporter, partial [Ramlibacter sp.]
VSHDRALLRAVCDEFWLVGRGVVSPFDGDLDDYQKYLLDEAKRLREVARLEASDAAKTVAVKKQSVSPSDLLSKLKPLRKEREQAEKRMGQLSNDKVALEGKLATPLPAPQMAEAGKQLKAVNDELHALEERWLALAGEIEGMETTS